MAAAGRQLRHDDQRRKSTDQVDQVPALYLIVSNRANDLVSKFQSM